MDYNWNSQKAKKPQVPWVYKRHGSKIQIIRYSKGKKKPRDSEAGPYLMASHRVFNSTFLASLSNIEYVFQPISKAVLSLGNLSINGTK